MNRAKALANAHWKYIAKLLKVHGVLQAIILIIGFHYRTAFIHGYKHGVEDTLKELASKIKGRKNDGFV